MVRLKKLLFVLLILCVLSVDGMTEESRGYGNGWVKVSLVQNGVYRFSENVGSIYSSNSYLIVGQSKAVLIDAGYGVENLKKICSEITSLPIVLINTCGHLNHIGSDCYFTDVFIHKNDAHFLEEPYDPVLQLMARNELKKNPLLPADFSLTTWNRTAVTPTKLLEDGEVLSFGGDIHLEVVWTPGHTQGSICLVDRERKLLFTGDTYGHGQMWLQTPDSDLCQWIESGMKLINYRYVVNKVLPGFGEPFDNHNLKQLGSIIWDVWSNKYPPIRINSLWGKCWLYYITRDYQILCNYQCGQKVNGVAKIPKDHPPMIF